MKSKSIISGWDCKESWATLSASTPIFLTFFFTYVYKSFKENAPCKECIKPTRMKYFQSGLLTSFILFSCYLFLWVVAFKTKSDAPMYVALGLVMFFGLVTIIYLSLYEFCVSFDVFYSKNKEQVVHNFLERVSGKKLKIIND
ncbi:hypothetical protein OVS_01250 [Mycoplasma ovis str. Michigan]|uniref:Uncharacterized protein n=1 Tax=Mycoplasma ovis str. Michigan TaxID=1415773 RepID=A0ABM5P1H8_9MOLU|nr:hypothetical protein OVS_01250 [Mycoplasma ovis str. Michigan]